MMIDDKKPFEEIVNEFSDEGITIKCLYNFKSQRDQIIKAFEGSIATKVKSLRKSGFPEIEEKLLLFMSLAAANGLPVNTTVIKEKAVVIAAELGITGFKGSNGWIDRLKTRHAINFTVFHGEANSVPQELCEDWITVKLPNLLQGYQPQDIFNADEFGFFWRLPPNKSYVISGQTFKNGKNSKERLSVLVGANSDGTEKLKLVVIGKSRQPRSFRNKDKLPVTYRNNKTAWMTSINFR